MELNFLVMFCRFIPAIALAVGVNQAWHMSSIYPHAWVAVFGTMAMGSGWWCPLWLSGARLDLQLPVSAVAEQ